MYCRDEVRGEQREWEEFFSKESKLRHSKLLETKREVKDKKDLFSSLETMFSKTEGNIIN